ncbi:MAG: type II toxin-antitoxin system HicA family toxin [Chloroflexi bacterium]|nr:type II toxin-antitoxin system HicA family toxin [Chloroflexota bacterium]
MTSAELLRALRRDGWYDHRQVGSHLHLKHPSKLDRIVVPTHAGKILKLGTLEDILSDAGLSVDDLQRLL